MAPPMHSVLAAIMVLLMACLTCASPVTGSELALRDDPQPSSIADCLAQEDCQGAYNFHKNCNELDANVPFGDAGNMTRDHAVQDCLCADLAGWTANVTDCVKCYAPFDPLGQHHQEELIAFAPATTGEFCALNVNDSFGGFPGYYESLFPLQLGVTTVLLPNLTIWENCSCAEAINLQNWLCYSWDPNFDCSAAYSDAGKPTPWSSTPDDGPSATSAAGIGPPSTTDDASAVTAPPTTQAAPSAASASSPCTSTASASHLVKRGKLEDGGGLN